MRALFNSIGEMSQCVFADGFYDEPAGNIMVFSDYTRDDARCTLAPGN